MKRGLITSIFLLTLVGRLGLGPLPVAAKQSGNTDEVKAQLGEPFTLGFGQWAALDTPEGFGVQFSSVEQDSRCPTNLDCVRVGEVIVQLGFCGNAIEDGDLYEIRDHFPNNKLEYNDYQIELLDVQPYPQDAAGEIAEDEYTVTLIVRESGAQRPEALPTPISSEDELIAALDQPFTLHVGQSAHLEDADFSLTFRSISDDSGCLTADDCSIMTADGSLVLRRGDETQLFSFSVSFDPETPFSTEFAGLAVQMTSIKQLGAGGHEATFVVTQPSAPSPNGGFEPEVIERCPYFSRFDAAAILQEDMQPGAVVNLRFYPQPDLADELQGLCGYAGVENIPYPATETPMIHLLTAVESERAVVAARLSNATIMELLPFAQNVLQENPQSRNSDFPRLVTNLSAGNYAEVIPFFSENAAQSESTQSEPISGIGDDGLWLWQQLPGGYFSLLLIQVGDDFSLVAALLGDEVDELTVLDYSVIIARRMIEQRSTPSTDDEPIAEPTNDEPPIGCDLLAADAEAILGEAVHEQVVIDPEMGCGYVPRNEPSPAEQGFIMSDANRGVLLQRLAGEELTNTLQDIADTVSEDSTQPNKAAQNLFKTLLSMGETAQAIQLLEVLAKGSKDWKVEKLTDASGAAVFLWGRADERRVAALLKLDQAGGVALVVASLEDNRQREDVGAALANAAERIE